MNYELRPSRQPRSCGPHPECPLRSRYCTARTQRLSCGRKFPAPSFAGLRGESCSARRSGEKTTPQACKEAEITVQKFYRWRKEFGGLKLDQAKRLKELEKSLGKRLLRKLQWEVAG